MKRTFEPSVRKYFSQISNILSFCEKVYNEGGTELKLEDIESYLKVAFYASGGDYPVCEIQSLDVEDGKPSRRMMTISKMVLSHPPVNVCFSVAMEKLCLATITETTIIEQFDNDLPD